MLQNYGNEILVGIFSSYFLFFCCWCGVLNRWSLRIYFLFILLLQLSDMQFLLSIGIKEFKYQQYIIRFYENTFKACWIHFFCTQETTEIYIWTFSDIFIFFDRNLRHLYFLSEKCIVFYYILKYEFHCRCYWRRNCWFYHCS